MYVCIPKGVVQRIFEANLVFDESPRRMWMEVTNPLTWNEKLDEALRIESLVFDLSNPSRAFVVEIDFVVGTTLFQDGWHGDIES